MMFEFMTDEITTHAGLPAAVRWLKRACGDRMLTNLRGKMEVVGT